MPPPTDITTRSSQSDSELQALMAFAERLAEQAASATLPRFRTRLAVDNKASGSGFDPVTAADREAERAIRQLILETYPGHGITGEEDEAVTAQSNLTWVIDPIDGTRSFIAGVPLWGTLIALNDGTSPIIGVMDQPYLGERFLGSKSERGMQSILKRANERIELKTRKCRDFSDAILTCTTPDMFEAPDEKAAFRAVKAKCRLTRYSMDCYGYCLLAMGQLDLVVESSLQPYDIQALIPIIEGAGGIVTTWSGQSAVDGGQILAAGDPVLHAQALDILKPAAR